VKDKRGKKLPLDGEMKGGFPLLGNGKYRAREREVSASRVRGEERLISPDRRRKDFIIYSWSKITGVSRERVERPLQARKRREEVKGKSSLAGTEKKRWRQSVQLHR